MNPLPKMAPLWKRVQGAGLARFITCDIKGRSGQAVGSLISGGCILAGGSVRNSVVGRNVRIGSGALIEDSVVLENCVIGSNARIRRAILDERVRVPDSAVIGYDLDQDRRLHHVTETGIVVVDSAFGAAS